MNKSPDAKTAEQEYTAYLKSKLAVIMSFDNWVSAQYGDHEKITPTPTLETTLVAELSDVVHDKLVAHQ